MQADLPAEIAINRHRRPRSSIDKGHLFGGQVAFLRVMGKEQRALAQIWASDVARKLSNLLAQIVLGGLGDIADRHEPEQHLALHHRNVATAALSHQAHHVEQGIVRRRRVKARSHDVADESLTRVAMSGDDPNQYVAFREDAHRVTALDHQYGADVVVIHDVDRIDHRRKGTYGIHVLPFSPKNVPNSRVQHSRTSLVADYTIIRILENPFS